MDLDIICVNQYVINMVLVLGKEGNGTSLLVHTNAFITGHRLRLRCVTSDIKGSRSILPIHES